MRVNADGTVLIPREFIQALGLKPGEEFVCAVEDHKLKLEGSQSDPGMQPPGRLSLAEYEARVQSAMGSIKPVIPLDEYFKWTRGTDEPL